MRRMMNPKAFVLLAVVFAGCSTRNQSSYLEIQRVVPGAYTAATATTPASCVVTASGQEVAFLNIDLTKRYGQVGVVVSSALAQNSNTGTGRLNSNDFIAEKTVLNYEVIGGGSSPGQVIAPAQGLVPTGGLASVVTFLFPQGGNFGASIPAGKSVRVIFHIEGKLTDGSSARTNEYEYVFVTCTGGATDCSSNQCL